MKPNPNVLEFLAGLGKLTRVYGLSISSCGCCGGPWLKEVGIESRGFEYTSNVDGGCLEFRSFEDFTKDTHERCGFGIVQEATPPRRDYQWDRDMATIRHGSQALKEMVSPEVQKIRDAEWAEIEATVKKATGES